MDNIGIIILAAGGSSRFGSPKQLLEFDGRSLLRRSVETALACDCRAVIVVLGAHTNDLLPEINDLPVASVVNKDWKSGISSSINSGLSALIALEPEISAAVFLLCDQPFVTCQTITRLIAKHRVTGKKIIACKYDGSVGVPALFSADHFPELLRLEGDRGAKSIISRHAKLSASIHAPEASVDIDDPDQYKFLAKILSAENRIEQPGEPDTA